jgi:hypothetical protein
MREFEIDPADCEHGDLDEIGDDYYPDTGCAVCDPDPLGEPTHHPAIYVMVDQDGHAYGICYNCLTPEQQADVDMDDLEDVVRREVG